RAELDDLRLAQPEQRRVHAVAGPAFYRCGGRHVGQLLERLDECRPAVGIARIVDGVHADVQILRVQRLRIAEGQPEQHGVAGGNVRDGDATADALLGDLE